MTKKICTACNDFNKDMQIVIEKADWVTKMGRKHHPPLTHVPSLDDLIEVEINMSKFANRYIYFFASESEHMLEQDGKLNKNGMKPHEAYDDFEW